MADVQAFQPINYDSSDLSRISRFALEKGFFDNTFETVLGTGTVFEDQYRVAWREPGNSTYLAVFAGTGLTQNGTFLSGGLVTGYFEFILRSAGWELIWGVKEIAIPGSVIAPAASTLNTADEFAIYDTMFAGPDSVSLSSGADVMRSGASKDLLQGNGGNDLLDGGTGTDTAFYTGPRGQYSVSVAGTFILVTDRTPNRDGQDSLQNIERLAFSDGLLAFDTAGTAGQVYRLYQAAFARTPDTAGLKHNTGLVENGLSLQQMSSAFLASEEFQQKYGTNVSDAAYINALYQNVLGRDADASGLAGWQARLNDGSWNRTSLLIGFSESPENIAKVAPAIANGIWLG
jgi:hypothetical protein